MRPRTGLLTFLAITLTVALSVLTSKRIYEKREPSRELPSSAVSPLPARDSPQNLRSLLSAPFRGEFAMQPGLSEACTRLEQGLFKMRSGDIGNPEKVEGFPSAEGCIPANPKIAKILKYYSLKCNATTAPSNAEARSDCALASLMLRSTLASIARGDRPLKEVTDIRELADLLVASFGEFLTDLSPSGLKEMSDISDRMLELDPGLIPAAKAGAMGSMLRNVLAKEATEKGEAPVEPPHWDDLEKRVARIEEMNPSDPDLNALHRIVETEGMEPERVIKDSLTRLSKDPGDSHEHQILAWANWRIGRRDEAKAELRRALSRKPDDPELRANWVTVNRRDAKVDDFKIAFKVGVGFTDLLK